MARARIAAVAALVLVLLLGATAAAAPGAVRPLGVTAQAAVAWPPSSGLLVAEVVTGGASASDEYVELTNASATAVDLAGLEVAYVTSSGSTVTRKASWTTPLALEPGRHLLVANASGIYAASADATYSGGFAATGGAIVLRPIGGQPDRRRRLGRRDERVRRGHRRSGSGGGQLDRATAGRVRRQHRRHERQRGGLRRQRGAGAQDLVGRADSRRRARRPPTSPSPGASATPSLAPIADRRRRPDPDADPDADSDADSDATDTAPTRAEPDSDLDAHADPDSDPTSPPRRQRRRRLPRRHPRSPPLRRRPSSPRRSRPCAPWPTARPRPSRAS